MISIHQVSKAFGQKMVLKKIDVTFPSGQTTSILAPSGHGKTTLLRLILGLLEPSAGEVAIFGQNPARLSPIRRAQTFGYVPQDGGPFPHLSAAQNILLGAKHFTSASACERRLQELTELVALDREILALYPAHLSGGQKQRIAIMRSLMLDPPLLLLDEPLSALDPINRRRLLLEFKSLFSKLKKTVIYITHNIEEAHYLSHEICFLYEGSLCQKGSWEEISQAPAHHFVRDYIEAQRPLSRF